MPRDAKGHVDTIVAPITHRPPDDIDASLEIPAAVCRSLGLDDGRHWICVDEPNRYLWPGYDLGPRSNGLYGYGVLPQGFLEQLRHGIISRQRNLYGKIATRIEWPSQNENVYRIYVIRSKISGDKKTIFIKIDFTRTSTIIHHVLSTPTEFRRPAMNSRIRGRRTPC